MLSIKEGLIKSQGLMKYVQLKLIRSEESACEAIKYHREEQIKLNRRRQNNCFNGNH